MIKFTKMNNTKFLWTIIVFLSLFIIVLFTKDQVFKLSENKNLISVSEDKKNELTEKNTKLTKIKKDLSNPGNSFYSEVEKYSKELKEDELLDFIYSKIIWLNWPSSSIVKRPEIKIENLRISNPKLNLMNFYESDINLELKIPSETKLKDVLNLLNENDDYKFFITSLSYENEESINSSEWMSVSIPLKVFYK